MVGVFCEIIKSVPVTVKYNSVMHTYEMFRSVQYSVYHMKLNLYSTYNKVKFIYICIV